MISPVELEKIVSDKRNNLRTDRLDMSFGELMSMYEEDTLFITPEYQRAFRWDNYKQTRFIESILLGIPVPPIFVAETKTATWELVDGLQRLSTIFSFFGILKHKDKNNLILEKGDILPELLGCKLNDLSPVLKFTLKKAVCRVEIIKWDSQTDMRYELFSRLNTGGEPLSDQEVRNCIFRGDSNDFNQLLLDLAKHSNFQDLIKPTSEQVEEMFCEELILRFFTLKNYGLTSTSNLQNHLTEYMKKVSKGELPFNVVEESKLFQDITLYLLSNFEYNIFRASNGIFTPAYYDAILLSLHKYFDVYKNDVELFKQKITLFKNSEEYKKTAQQSYSLNRIENRIEVAYKIFEP
jgi:hypothetical protein